MKAIDYIDIINRALQQEEIGYIVPLKSGRYKAVFFKEVKCSVCGGRITRGRVWIIAWQWRDGKTKVMYIVHDRCKGGIKDWDGIIPASWGIIQAKYWFYV